MDGPIYNGKTPRVAPAGLYGPRNVDRWTVKECPYCKTEYKRYEGEIRYIHKNKEFCTWTCKSRYIQKHPQKKKDTPLDYRFMDRSDIIREIMFRDSSYTFADLISMRRLDLEKKLKELRGKK